MAPALSFGLFAAGFLAGTSPSSRRRRRPVRRRAQFDLWAVLIGGLGGLCFASALYYVVWLVGVVRLCDGARRARSSAGPR